MDTVAQGKLFPNIREVFQLIITFSLEVFCWIFFRVPTITDAFLFINKMIMTIHIGVGYPFKLLEGDLSLLILILMMFVFEWVQREQLFALRLNQSKLTKPIRWGIYILIALCIVWFYGEEAEFIYFQF